MRVAVIGGGIVGVCAAYHLAKDEHDVVLLEREKIGSPNPFSSSGDHSKVFRCSYDSELYARAAVEARELYDRIQLESAFKFIVDCGMLVLGSRQNAEPWAQWTTKSQKVMDAIGWPHEIIEACDLPKRFPYLHTNGSYDHALLDDLAGYFLARKTVRTIGKLAVKHGADVRERVSVTGMRESNGCIDALLTDRGEINADMYICAAGAWAAKLFPQLLGRYVKSVTRQQTVYFAPDNRELFTPKKFPIFVSLKEGFYVFPIHKTGRFKVSNHNPIQEVDADNFESEGDDVFVEQCRGFLREYIPSLANSRAIESRSCLYTNAHNDDFIIDRAPWAKNLIIASACSGHGFKHGSLTGKIAADLALDETPIFYSRNFTFNHHDKARLKR